MAISFTLLIKYQIALEGPLHTSYSCTKIQLTYKFYFKTGLTLKCRSALSFDFTNQLIYAFLQPFTCTFIAT